MISIVSIEQLKFKASFNQESEQMIDDLRARFIKLYGEETYVNASIIIVAEKEFFHVIKNIYNLPALYEFKGELNEYLFNHLDL